MHASAGVDVPRLIRVATLLFALLAGALVYFTYEPKAAAYTARIDDAQAELRSDEIALSEMPRLERERTELGRRYARPFAENVQAVFLHELAAIVRRHGVMLVTTSVLQDDAEHPDGARKPLFAQTSVTLELRGTYRHLLAAVEDLSLGSQIVAVQTPSFRRDGKELVATVPATIYEPAHAPTATRSPSEHRLP